MLPFPPSCEHLYSPPSLMNMKLGINPRLGGENGERRNGEIQIRRKIGPESLINQPPTRKLTKPLQSLFRFRSPTKVFFLSLQLGVSIHPCTKSKIVWTSERWSRLSSQTTVFYLSFSNDNFSAPSCNKVFKCPISGTRPQYTFAKRGEKKRHEKWPLNSVEFYSPFGKSCLAV